MDWKWYYLYFCHPKILFNSFQNSHKVVPLVIQAIRILWRCWFQLSVHIGSTFYVCCRVWIENGIPYISAFFGKRSFGTLHFEKLMHSIKCTLNVLTIKLAAWLNITYSSEISHSHTKPIDVLLFFCYCLFFLKILEMHDSSDKLLRDIKSLSFCIKWALMKYWNSFQMKSLEQLDWSTTNQHHFRWSNVCQLAVTISSLKSECHNLLRVRLSKYTFFPPNHSALPTCLKCFKD